MGFHKTFTRDVSEAATWTRRGYWGLAFSLLCVVVTNAFMFYPAFQNQAPAVFMLFAWLTQVLFLYPLGILRALWAPRWMQMEAFRKKHLESHPEATEEEMQAANHLPLKQRVVWVAGVAFLAGLFYAAFVYVLCNIAAIIWEEFVSNQDLGTKRSEEILPYAFIEYYVPEVLPFAAFLCLNQLVYFLFVYLPNGEYKESTPTMEIAGPVVATAVLGICSTIIGFICIITMMMLGTIVSLVAVIALKVLLEIKAIMADFRSRHGEKQGEAIREVLPTTV